LTTPTDPTHLDPPQITASAALFLDFDGTLAPLAPRPQDVQTPAWVVPTLRRLQAALNGALAVISGRPIDQLDHFLQPLRLPSAGVHGAERRGADGLVASVATPPPAHVVACAQALAARHEGLILELKKSGFSLHYRARPELEAICRDALFASLAAEPETMDAWEWISGHFVFELKRRGVSKGSAVRAFMAEPAFAGRLAVFVGDDVTDEDGIRAAQAHGGYGVRVGDGASEARYRLANVAAVAAWLGAAARELPSAQPEEPEAHKA
jgi:trehalose 6-phosphate phosphatase